MTWELGSFFHHVGLAITQLIRLGGNDLYWLSHLNGLEACLLSLCL